MTYRKYLYISLLLIESGSVVINTPRNRECLSLPKESLNGNATVTKSLEEQGFDDFKFHLISVRIWNS